MVAKLMGRRSHTWNHIDMTAVSLDVLKQQLDLVRLVPIFVLVHVLTFDVLARDGAYEDSGH